MRFEEIPGPAAIVFLDRLRRNCEGMSARARALGVRLRPHVKTHKCPWIARLQTEGDADPGLTVSTLAEARAMAAAGFQDLLLAVPLPPGRFAEALASVPSLSLIVDDPRAVDALASAARASGRRVPVWIEVDGGLGRSGVEPHGDLPLRLAERLLRTPGLRFEGLLTHAGQAYAANPGSIADIAAEERDLLVELAGRLRGAGIEVPGLSLGSTPTIRAVDQLGGIREIRPGNYVYFDATQAALGACALSEAAFFVLATVISANPDRLVLDTGALALSRDAGPRHLDPHFGFGLLADLSGSLLHEGLRVEALTQEHAVVPLRGRDAALGLGDRVLVLPNHACLSAACFDRVHVVQAGEIIGVHATCRGW